MGDRDLISRKDAIDICQRYNGIGWTWVKILNGIRKLPSAEPERKKGEWIDDEFVGQYRCSECDYYAIDEYDFCPSCGADMGGEQE